jgi:hypothetical protein
MARRQVTNDQVFPVWQLHAKTGHLAAEQSVGSLNRWWQTKPITASSDCGGVADFGFDGYDVAQWLAPLI